MLEFRYRLLPFNPKELKPAIMIVNRIEADFSILVDNRILWHEPYVCVVEFAISAAEWLRQVRDQPVDFLYTSVESEEEYLIKFCKEDNGWKIVAKFPEYEEDRIFALDELVSPLETFIDKLIKDVHNESSRKIDIRRLIDGTTDYAGKDPESMTTRKRVITFLLTLAVMIPLLVAGALYLSRTEFYIVVMSLAVVVGIAHRVVLKKQKRD